MKSKVTQVYRFKPNPAIASSPKQVSKSNLKRLSSRSAAGLRRPDHRRLRCLTFFFFLKSKTKNKKNMFLFTKVLQFWAIFDFLKHGKGLGMLCWSKAEEHSPSRKVDLVFSCEPLTGRFIGERMDDSKTTTWTPLLAIEMPTWQRELLDFSANRVDYLLEEHSKRDWEHL